ncbi:MAG: protein-disulfide reductase DsbD N-terminal domain-containing protein [Opitutaceae bacterium]|nr:protein-disulfide reductase DsbD N-terminal domain-containing protein [Opitutaceae bacterium]
MNSILRIAAILLLGTVPAFSAQPAKQPLRVLYVGGSVDWADGNESAIPKDPPADDPRVAERMRSFETMLKRYFTSVTVIHAKDYRQEKSADYDVTVLDGTPPEREPRRVVRDAAGRVTDYVPARFLTEDFNRPVLVIGELGDKLGRRIGLKFDWYCLCLDAHAHSFRTEHPIFHGPFPVKMTIEDLPTPEDAFHYEYFRDSPTPKTLPMWRVQTKGYKTDKGFRIGMVARPWGFEDSPDAEYISSGVCAKTLDAVAIGRHGNFLGWGFAASPAYLTPEAQTVLANAVCYIAKFDGQGLIARKYNDRRATKEWVRELKYQATPESLEARKELYLRHGERMTALKQEAEAKQARGEKLGQMEQISLSYKPQPEQTFAEYLSSSRSFKELFAKHGTNYAAYLHYYDENLPWFYSEAESYRITVDEDVKSIGIPNTDPRILDRAITMWEQGQDTAKARRILTRYTLLDYATAGEWRSWFEQNKSRLFFTQVGGFVFMVNTRDPAIPGNDYAAKARAIGRAATQPGTTDDMNPVSVAAGVVDMRDGRKELVVKLRIHPGYHIYSHVDAADPFIPTKLNLKLPSGYQTVGTLNTPPFRPYNESGTTGLYTGEITFAQEISGSGQGEATINLSYQCCDASICFPPADQELVVKLN